MQIGSPKKDPHFRIAHAATRLFLISLGCAAWAAVWTVVYRATLGI